MKRNWFWGLIGVLGLCTLGICVTAWFAAKRLTELFHDFRDISYDVFSDQIVFNAVGRGERDLFMLDLRTGQVSHLTDSATREFDPRFSPDGRKIVYAAYRSASTSTPASLYEMELATRTVRRLTRESFADFEPRYMPDGKAILFGRAHRLRRYSMGGTVWDRARTY